MAQADAVVCMYAVPMDADINSFTLFYTETNIIGKMIQNSYCYRYSRMLALSERILSFMLATVQRNKYHAAQCLYVMLHHQ